MGYEQQFLSLSEAAELTGKSRTTLWRAVKSGKLSGQKGENDQWLVHLSELERVYSRVNVAQRFQKQRVEQSEKGVAPDVSQAKLELLEEDRARLLKQLDELREELRTERSENRAERDKLLGLVENAQKQLSHERGRFDEEIKRAKAKIRSFAQEQRRPRGANSNKILNEDKNKGASASKPSGGLLGYLFGR